MRKVYLIILVFLVYYSNGQIKESKPGYKNYEETDTNSVYLNSLKFVFANSGKLIYNDFNNKKHEFQLIDEGRIEAIHGAPYESGTIFAISVDDGISTTGYLFQFNVNPPKVKWKIPINPPGPFLINGDNIYLTGFGFIGKYSLSKNVYLWKHEGLYDEKSQNFDYFLTPELTNGNVVFKSKHIHTKKINTLIVNDLTGEHLVFDGSKFETNKSSIISYFQIKPNSKYTYKSLGLVNGKSNFQTYRCTQVTKDEGKTQVSMSKMEFGVEAIEIYEIDNDFIKLVYEKNKFSGGKLAAPKTILKIPAKGMEAWNWGAEKFYECTRVKNVTTSLNNYDECILITETTKVASDPNYKPKVKRYYAKGVGLVKTEFIDSKGALVDGSSFQLYSIE